LTGGSGRRRITPPESATSSTVRAIGREEADAIAVCHACRRGHAGALDKEPVMNGVRIAITAFILILLAIVALGWVWTGSHQPPPQKIASHVVLAIAALAGILALVRIWRNAPPGAGSGGS
jgi:hypothetical protein